MPIFSMLFGLLYFLSLESFANPCAGKGTKIFFLNGVFNNKKIALEKLAKFRNSTHPALTEIPHLTYELAWIEDQPGPIQLARAVAQRGVDDFQNFWLWVEGLETAPDWFEELMQKHVIQPSILEATTHPRITEHLELYSKAILEGYQVLIISHSVGGFYANAALRTLPSYVPQTLQPSLTSRQQENPLYPAPEQLISSIQIATPVKEMVGQSSWVNFKDDAVLNWINQIAPTVSGNVNSPGQSSIDSRGHSLVESYLRIKESRDLIIQNIKTAHSRLKYPIAFFQPAATVQYLSIDHGKSTPTLNTEFYQNNQEITRTEEQPFENNSRYLNTFADCYTLRPGIVEIRAETLSENRHPKSFRATGFEGDTSGASHPLTLPSTQAIQKWILGTIEVAPGKQKDPIDARVQFLAKPASQP